jgi:hypothetical protein
MSRNQLIDQVDQLQPQLDAARDAMTHWLERTLEEADRDGDDTNDLRVAVNLYQRFRTNHDNLRATMAAYRLLLLTANEHSGTRD